MSNCKNCRKEIKRRASKYCSNKCQQEAQHDKYIRLWKLGLVSGTRGIRAKNISSHIRRYLLRNNPEACSICHWDKINSRTKHVPLEIDHINGNPEDNTENNLRLICPNCHSLSSNFRNLNKGKGRIWRLKYLRENSQKSQIKV